MSANIRLVHDTCFALARVLLNMTQHLMSEDCHKDAVDAYYEACKAAFQKYEELVQRQASRLVPSRN